MTAYLHVNFHQRTPLNAELALLGTLDRVDKVNRFTGFRVDATLTVPRGADADKARRLRDILDRVDPETAKDVQARLAKIEGEGEPE